MAQDLYSSIEEVIRKAVLEAFATMTEEQIRNAFFGPDDAGLEQTA